ncbi:hypothetical protein I350_04375 [Cryptococcus amylolentus CBS 6273]|uniref:BTB domain-containing protein n=1 Tax=Cryptococcus amylolentus CBS 6273 TaxID=1296118 RepID=A0A1E3K1G3_9TREE|nr:hypothetical protein I350_04375 [Cryptococcus amylolentus CBS 6273]
MPLSPNAPVFVSRSQNTINNALPKPVASSSTVFLNPQPTPRVIHPSYIHQSLDDILLLTSDNVGFYVSLAFLTRYSGFFADFESFPQSDGEKADADKFECETREVPNATSLGLHLVLDALTEVENMALLSTLPHDPLPGFKPSSKPFVDQWPLEKVYNHLGDAVKLADAYDIPEFSAYMRIVLPSTAWHQYLMAALSENETLAKTASTLTLPYHVENMPPEVVSILYKQAPNFLMRIRSLHKRKRKSLPGLTLAMIRAVPMADGTADFAKKCKRNGGCSSYVRYEHLAPDLRWKKFRADAGETMGDITENAKRDEGVERLMRRAINDHVDCQVCGARLLKTFDYAWQNWKTEWRPQTI